MFCEYNPSVPNNSDKSIHNQIDLKNDHGYIVLAPSIHPETGEPYEWISEDKPLGVFPELILRKIKELGMEVGVGGRRKRMEPEDFQKLLKGVREGSGGRNVSATKVIGKLIYMISRELGDDPVALGFVWDSAVLWNKRCEPPMEEHELKTVFMHIVGKHYAPRAGTV